MLEWEYAPPPTVYDLVRDSIPLRVARILVHLVLRQLIKRYNGLTATGVENVLHNMPCIITAKHSSHLDTVAIFTSLPLRQVNNTCPLAAKDYFFDNAFLAFWARLVGNCIPIDRTGSDKRGLLLCASKQREGRNIIIFPEGTRRSTYEVGKFKKGAVMLSREVRTPVIPTYIRGTLESLPKSGLFPRRKRITVVFGKPVNYWQGDLAELDHQAAAEHLQNLVVSLQQELEKGDANVK